MTNFVLLVIKCPCFALPEEKLFLYFLRFFGWWPLKQTDKRQMGREKIDFLIHVCWRDFPKIWDSSQRLRFEGLYHLDRKEGRERGTYVQINDF